MADKTVRVRILRHVQGDQLDAQGDKEILTAGSVLDVSATFGGELVGSNAAQLVEADEKLVKVPLHPVEKSTDKK